MSTPEFDPNLPADNSLISSGELRGQFQALSVEIGGIRGKLISLTPLGLSVSDPPTQAEVQALADKLDEVINTLNG